MPVADLEIIYRDPTELVAYDRNARLHSDEQVDEIAGSIERFGFTNPILLKDDGKTIGAGHGRQLASLRLGLDRVPTVTLRGLTDEEWRAYVVADNRLAEKATWDLDLLRSEVADIFALDLSLPGLALVTPDGPTLPTHWAFGQLAAHADAPSGYLRKLRPDLAADCMNWGLQRKAVEEIGVLTYQAEGGVPQLSAATGPNYGRIWDLDIVNSLMHQFGDGRTGHFKIPGEFGVQVPITKENTTLYASDRDCFIFLADEERRIEMPNRRNGQSGSLARGFFVENSEVGAATLRVSAFFFDYACKNRCVWGVEGFQEIAIRHTSSAPDRFIEEIKPALISYSESSDHSFLEAIAAAQARRVDDIDDFLKGRGFSRAQGRAIQLVHQTEEGRPIETIWDAVTGATAYAKGIDHQDERVGIERSAGRMLKLAL